MSVPLVNPLIGAKGLVYTFEVVAGLVLLTSDLLASVEVKVALIAVPEKLTIQFVIKKSRLFDSQ